MGRLFTPDLRVAAVSEISLRCLQGLGLRSLLLDVDSTLTRFRSLEVDRQVIEWLAVLRAAGVGLCLVSNGRKSRIGRLAEQLGLPFVARAMKPLPFACRKAIRRMGFDRSSTALVGDQLLTDVLGARLAGLKSILVEPIGPETDPWWLRIRRPLERMLFRSARPNATGETSPPD